MADRWRRAPRSPRLGLAGAVLLGAGCAPMVPGAPAAPPPLTPAERTEVVEMMRAEDARDPRAAPAFAALQSPSAALRARGAVGIGRVRPSGAREALTPLLADPDTMVAASAAFALGQLGDTTAVGPLSALLGEPQARVTVAAEAAYALGKLRTPVADEALRAYLAAAPAAARGEPVASALLATWRHPRPPALEPITRWLTSADAELRWRAAYALVRRPSPAAAPLLLAAARDEDARVRAQAIRGLAFPQADTAGVADAALPLLVDALRDPAYEVRINAARALGSYARPAAVQALEAALGSGEPHLAVAAAESLGRLGAAAASAAPALRAAALDPAARVFVRQSAMEALARVDATVARQVAIALRADQAWRLRVAAARAFAAPTVGARADAEALTRDPDARVAAAALQALVDAAGDQLAPLRPLLIGALGSPDVGVRTAALGGLARLADPSTLPLLLDAYDRATGDRDNDAALAAVDAIARLETASVVPTRAFFGRFQRSPDYLVRLRVAERFAAAAAPWGDPLPLQPRPADYAALLEHAHRAGPTRVRMVTDHGTIQLRLLDRLAPLTVANFLALARAGYFDGQEWPRVVPNFVVQGGDPRGDTSGGPGYSIRDEINRVRYGTGTLGMALSGPDTGGSQWFVTHSPQPHLDGIYTVFGEVEEGQEVTERLLPGDRILRIEILP
jgi:cyclophilin family peptidyl-prolyl cis-trans isomerase